VYRDHSAWLCVLFFVKYRYIAACEYNLKVLFVKWLAVVNFFVGNLFHYAAFQLIAIEE
jgi:hypothetical protein